MAPEPGLVGHNDNEDVLLNISKNEGGGDSNPKKNIGAPEPNQSDDPNVAATAADPAPPLYRVYFVLFLLILAYCAKYFCTSCMYVAQDLFLPDQNVSELELSWMFVFGYDGSTVATGGYQQHNKKPWVEIGGTNLHPGFLHCIVCID